MKRIGIILLAAILALSCMSGCSQLTETLSSVVATPMAESQQFSAGAAAPAEEPAAAVEHSGAIVELAAEVPAEEEAEAPAEEEAETPAEEAVEAPVLDTAPGAEEDAAEQTPAPVFAINPLTGEPAEEGATAKRPYAVMINNISLAQPQVGIAKADMIWELMDEGGITRCMALYTNLEDVDVVGSIRSARWYNVSVTQAYDAIFVHAGGSDEAMAYIDYDHISNVNALLHENTDAFYRDPDRQANGVEHSLFGHGAAIVEMAKDIGYEQEHDEYFDGTYGLTFSEDAADQCKKDATKIHITYAGGKTMDFTYDPETDMYTAEQFGEVYADNGEEVLQFKNILILEAKTSLQEDGLHLTIKLEKGNDGYFCCGGKYLRIKWLRDGYEDTFHFYTRDYEPLALGIGKTFVAVQQEGEYEGTTEFIA